jgi:hypothetical protein
MTCSSTSPEGIGDLLPPQPITDATTITKAMTDATISRRIFLHLPLQFLVPPLRLPIVTLPIPPVNDALPIVRFLRATFLRDTS